MIAYSTEGESNDGKQSKRRPTVATDLHMSFDPVAHDAAGLQLYREVRSSEGHDTEPVAKKVTLWLENAAELGLGTNDPDSTDWVEVNLT